MRLLNVRTYRLKEYFDSEIPDYAILSHTWGRDEVTFQDIQAFARSGYQNQVPDKEGFRKIRYACQQAARDNLEYVWVDTCCIDRSSSVELLEAINSMYQWYLRSSKCYVYLTDVPRDHPEVLPDEKVRKVSLGGRSIVSVKGRSPSHPEAVMDSPFARCRWFTRGWTLQELIAPNDLTFYGSGWNFLGTKASLVSLIFVITGIDQQVLQDSTDTKESLRSICISQKMSWAATRRTSRIEDAAYCLLGLFDVHMPVLYGEGRAAFIRLQEEIMRTSDDQTLFAWTYCDIERERPYTILAPSSSCFLKNVVQWSRPRSTGPYVMTNRGLHIPLPVIQQPGHRKACFALLDCHYEDDVTGILALPLAPRSDGTYELDHDSSRGRLVRVDLGMETSARPRDLYIRLQPSVPDPRTGLTCRFNLDGGESAAPPFSVKEFYPSRVWDPETRTLRLTSKDSSSFETWAAVKFEDPSGKAIGVVFHVSPRQLESASFDVHSWVYMQRMEKDASLAPIVDQVIRGCSSGSAYEYGGHESYTLAFSRRYNMVATNTYLNGPDPEIHVNVTVMDRHAKCSMRRFFDAKPKPTKTLEGPVKEKNA
ncbi:HET-domain-containing protein [Aspergillus sclerotioniger CBS 115572]|uniref:HET-domain-containing protein n=1 Tax=Aspergillus sclerotioniger CBS 115572 TaxID=1450535 RepID=A0A317X6I4_9EURO|nr:HET-domain-containing protein [Aspergillus sclerotioniger CBS 115572]PWY94234.1 HET-domain-containing protein [Aspergillus sclerotioniger CBS 115572]